MYIVCLQPRSLESQGLEVNLSALPSSQSAIITLPVETPPALSQSVQIGSKRSSAEISL